MLHFPRWGELFALAFASTALFAASGAFARPVTALPYSTRTRPYNGWQPAVRGDLASVGMSGSGVGVPFGVSTSDMNPAGHALTMPSVHMQFNPTSRIDEETLRHDGSVEEAQWGLAISAPPWGGGLSYYTQMTEEGMFTSTGSSDPFWAHVAVKELRLTVARTFLEDRLSLGVAASLYQGVRRSNGFGFDSSAWSYRVGCLYRLQSDWIIGFAYSPRVELPAGEATSDQSALPGFNQAILVPSVWAAGLGYYPHRFLRFGMSVHGVADEEGGALLADESVSVGRRFTLQPRLGARYTMGEFENLRVELAVGAYLEISRMSDKSDRLHGTASVEVNPWFLNTGVGIDLSRNYRNLMVSVGVDVIRLSRQLGVIPKEKVKPLERFWPPLRYDSAEGLPTPMTRGDTNAQQANTSLSDVQEIIEKIPQRVEEQFEKNQRAKARPKQSPKSLRKSPPKRTQKSRKKR